MKVKGQSSKLEVLRHCVEAVLIKFFSEMTVHFIRDMFI